MRIVEVNRDNTRVESEEFGMRAYVNSARDRSNLIADCGTEITNVVFFIWGDTPSIIEPEPQPPAEAFPSTEERLAAVEAAVLDIILGGSV